jgi:hypothetical protein
LPTRTHKVVPTLAKRGAVSLRLIEIHPLLICDTPGL